MADRLTMGIIAMLMLGFLLWLTQVDFRLNVIKSFVKDPVSFAFGYVLGGSFISCLYELLVEEEEFEPEEYIELYE